MKRSLVRVHIAANDDTLYFYRTMAPGDKIIHFPKDSLRYTPSTPATFIQFLDALDIGQVAFLVHAYDLGEREDGYGYWIPAQAYREACVVALDIRNHQEPTPDASFSYFKQHSTQDTTPIWWERQPRPVFLFGFPSQQSR